jgi:hypothetical protein
MIDQFSKAIDAQLAEISRLDAEIAHVSETISQLDAEVNAADDVLEKATAAQASIELRARLDGAKIPKSPHELESLRFAAVRLVATHKAAELMLVELKAARAGALTDAHRLAKAAANDEFEAIEAEVGVAWQAFLNAFGRYSAAAYFANRDNGWNGQPLLSQTSFDMCTGSRVERPEMDASAYGRAIAASPAGALRERIDGMAIAE